MAVSKSKDGGPKEDDDGKGVKARAYRLKVAEFSRLFLRVHREAGEPSYRDVAMELGPYCSPASVYRYLNGEILPRWGFVSRYLEAYQHELDTLGDEKRELKQRWLAAREALKPINGEGGDAALA